MKKRIEKYNSKNNRTLIENFFSLGALQIINLILPLVVLPYMIRVVGFDRYGIIVIAASLVAYFSSITDYSFRITATRDVAVFRDSQNKLNYIFSKVIVVKVLLLLVSWFLILLIVYLYPPFFEERLVFFCTSLMLFGYVLFPEWFFQGIEKMKYIAFLNVSIKIFFTICIFIFVQNPDDYWKYPLLNSIGYIGAGFIGQLILFKKYNIRFRSLNVKSIIGTIKMNFPIFVNQFVPNLYNNTSTFLLGLLTSPNIVGIYDAIKKIIDVGIMVLSVIARVFFPYLNRNKKGFNKFKKLFMAVGVFLTLMPLFFHKCIFWYLNLVHEQAFTVLFILAIGVFFIALYDIYGLNYFVIRRQDKLVMKNTLLASFVGVLLAFPMISVLGIIGAALNLTIARGIMGIGIWAQYFKLNIKT